MPIWEFPRLCMMEVASITDHLRDDPNVVMYQIVEDPDISDQHTLRVEVPEERLLPPVLQARTNGRSPERFEGVFDSNTPHGATEAVLAALMEAHDNDFSVGPEMDDIDRDILEGVERDAAHMAHEVRVGLGVPNANGDLLNPEVRQHIAMEIHRHIRENLERSMPVRHISRPPVGFSRILSAESPGIERVIQEEYAVSMGCSVPYEPRGVLGGEPASQPASVMGPDELSRNLSYFTARDLGVGSIIQLGLTGGGEEHPEGFRTEYLGTVSNPDSHTERLADLSRVVNPADRSAVLGTRVTVPEFEILANPTLLADLSRVVNPANPTIRIGDVQPLPFKVGAWIMARGLILQVEMATHEEVFCRIWDPQRKRFLQDPMLSIKVEEASKCPEPPARTPWDWLMMD